MALINEVYEYIENKYKPNEPIFLAELDIPDMKPVSVRQQMKKLTEEGRLKRFDAGIYYIPKKSMFKLLIRLSSFLCHSSQIFMNFFYSNRCI